MIIEKQVNGNNMVGLDDDEVVAESVGKWGVCWGTAKGRIGVLFGQFCEVVG
jgi:hypothetical protein